MKKIFFILFLPILATKTFASTKQNIIQNLDNTQNITFNFEQNINGKIENGSCTIQYPKKIFCEYDMPNQKILVSNGKSLVIKTRSSYYLYPLDKTPLSLILNKKFLLNKISILKERLVEDKFINYNFNENENKINIFFDQKTFNLIGWQTLDIYQNLSITYLSSIIKNQKIDKNLFKLPVKD